MQKMLAPEVGAERVDTYAKWVFGGTAAVAALSGLYTKQIVGDLNEWGRLAAALGIGALGGAMAAAVRALAPVMVKYNPNSVDSMEDAVNTQFAQRRPWVQWAGWSLAAALVLFGLAPLGGAAGERMLRKELVRPRNQTALSYQATSRPGIQASLIVSGAAPYRPIEIAIEWSDSFIGVAQAAALTDSLGIATVKVTADSLPAGVYNIRARYTPITRKGASATLVDAEVRSVRLATPPARFSAPVASSQEASGNPRPR
jgi:hypothetical protein